MKPIKDEKWIEKYRKHEFWISKKDPFPQAFYSRLTRSYVGWWCYFRLQYSKHGRLALLIDPLSCGGLWSHVNCFLYNAVIVDIWWSFKHWVWRIFYPKQWQEQQHFMDAIIRATREGYADPMPPPPGFENGSFTMLGERYFKRVAEIMKEQKTDE